jgi:L-alanine-DL-glutamate epimerase-like enolase superfamily enzyme
VVTLVSAIREAVGSQIDLLLEIHGQLEQAAAIRLAHAMEGFGFLFYEEPIEPSNSEAMAAVQRSTSIPVATGERLAGREAFRPYLEASAVGVIQPDTGICGGLLEAKKIAAMAEAYRVTVAPHNYCGPVNTMAAFHLDANIPNLLMQEWRPYEPSWHYELAMEPLPPLVEDGYMPLPAKPGLGVELNEALAKEHPYTVSRPRRRQ